MIFVFGLLPLLVFLALALLPRGRAAGIGILEGARWAYPLVVVVGVIGLALFGSRVALGA